MISQLALVQTESIGPDVDVHPFAIVGPDVTLGARVVVHAHSVLEGEIEVGDDVVILPGVHIGRKPTPNAAVSRRPGDCRPVRIGDKSSIGSNAVIYTDVHIGANTLIGDGASIREGSRWTGVPVGPLCHSQLRLYGWR